MRINTNVLIQVNPLDNVAIAKKNLEPGTPINTQVDHSRSVQVIARIPAGHKVALKPLRKGDSIFRYGEAIGTASQEIAVGEHVHTHNVKPTVYDQNYMFSKLDWRSISSSKRDQANIIHHPEMQRVFQGFQRVNGRVGTRNYIAVIASVQCAAQVCQRIANYFNSEYLKKYPNVDGVIALTHNGGCGQTSYDLLRRTINGIANHPNVAGAVLVGLGCEGNQLEEMWSRNRMIGVDLAAQPRRLEIQALGGTRKTIKVGIEAVEAILVEANKARRSPQPLSKLILALECGGSDSWSGITANPLVGQVSDLIVNQGGTVVMAETPEVFGAEHLLLKRAIEPEVGQRLIEKLTWWRDYVIRIGGSLENNPSPGNRIGGLTNICEKSLGAIAKSGSSLMRAVYDYAETIQIPGFVFMDTPGNDPISITGMVAGGCTLVLFTTGRGSVFGFKPAPSLKVSTNTKTFLHMIEDMDFNAGRILEGGETMENLSSELLDLVIATASGKKSKSEELGLGEIEFVPWFKEGFM